MDPTTDCSTHGSTDTRTPAPQEPRRTARESVEDRIAAASRPWTVAVVNYKGGTGKTTTAAHLAHVWTDAGLRVTAVDADHPQYALQRWAELADWAVPVVGLGSKQLHTRLPGIFTTATTDVVLIDTPPLEDERGIVTSALRAADTVLVTLAPTTAELHRTGAILDALDDTAALRATPAEVLICLNRVDRRSRADRIIRAALAGAGHHVLDHDVPLRQAYAQAFGAPVQVDEIWSELASELARTTGAGVKVGGVA